MSNLLMYRVHPNIARRGDLRERHAYAPGYVYFPVGQVYWRGCRHIVYMRRASQEVRSRVLVGEECLFSRASFERNKGRDAR